MAANSDPQRRPVFIDRVNQRFLADPAIGGSPWPVITITPGMFADIPGNTVLGRYGSAGAPSALTADVVIDLVNSATSQTISAARIAAASTAQAGVVQLDSSVSSASNTTAATSSAVKSAYDLAASASSLAGSASASASSATATANAANTTANAANATANAASTTANAALPRSGGTMSGPVVFAAGQTIAGYASLSVTQSFTAAQRGGVVTLSPGASVTPDFALGNNFSLTLNQATTLQNPVNMAEGQSGAIAITQDSTARALSYGSYWKFNGGAPSLDSTPNGISVLAYYVESLTRITAVLVQNSVS